MWCAVEFDKTMSKRSALNGSAFASSICRRHCSEKPAVATCFSVRLDVRGHAEFCVRRRLDALVEILLVLAERRRDFVRRPIRGLTGVGRRVEREITLDGRVAADGLRPRRVLEDVEHAA